LKIGSITACPSLYRLCPGGATFDKIFFPSCRDFVEEAKSGRKEYAKLSVLPKAGHGIPWKLRQNAKRARFLKSCARKGLLCQRLTRYTKFYKAGNRPAEAPIL
jgi:hypothetical protein